MWADSVGKQLKQMMHVMKKDILQQLEMVILQSIEDKELIALASLAIMNKYKVLPHVPKANVSEVL